MAAVASMLEAKLASAFQQLVDAELIFRGGQPPDALYTFKHALVQDAAYTSLLNSRRQVMHRNIAEGTFGGSHDGRLLVVSHTDRRGAVRITSIRRALRGERRIYEEG